MRRECIRILPVRKLPQVKARAVPKSYIHLKLGQSSRAQLRYRTPVSKSGSAATGNGCQPNGVPRSSASFSDERNRTGTRASSGRKLCQHVALRLWFLKDTVPKLKGLKQVAAT